MLTSCLNEEPGKGLTSFTQPRSQTLRVGHASRRDEGGCGSDRCEKAVFGTHCMYREVRRSCSPLCYVVAPLVAPWWLHCPELRSEKSERGCSPSVSLV